MDGTLSCSSLSTDYNAMSVFGQYGKPASQVTKKERHNWFMNSLGGSKEVSVKTDVNKCSRSGFYHRYHLSTIGIFIHYVLAPFSKCN